MTNEQKSKIGEMVHYVRPGDVKNPTQCQPALIIGCGTDTKIDLKVCTARDDFTVFGVKAEPRLKQLIPGTWHNREDHL